MKKCKFVFHFLHTEKYEEDVLIKILPNTSIIGMIEDYEGMQLCPVV